MSWQDAHPSQSSANTHLVLATSQLIMGLRLFSVSQIVPASGRIFRFALPTLANAPTRAILGYVGVVFMLTLDPGVVGYRY